MPTTRIERSPRFDDKALRARFMAKKPTREDFDLLVQEDTDAFDPVDGRLIFCFRKGVVPRQAVDLARDCFGKIADIEKPSTTRASAAGELDLDRLRAIRPDAVDVVKKSDTVGFLKLSDGRVLPTPVSNPVMSFLAGYGCEALHTEATSMRITRHFPKEWRDSFPFFQAINQVHAKELPDVHARHLERIALHPQWRIADTALSTCTINVNYESHYHYDVGDFKDGYSTLTVVEVGSYDGGFLVYPRYGIAAPPLTLAPQSRWISAGEALDGVVLAEPKRFSTKKDGLINTVWHKVLPGEYYKHHVARNTGAVSLFNHHKLSPAVAAPTLSSGCWGHMAHWAEPRLLDVEEWRLLGAFPGDYAFESANIGGYMIGMSVPPLMTKAVADAIAAQWVPLLPP